MLQAIIFDFDGVIANSEPLHFQAFRDVLAGERVTLTEADYYSRYLGYDDVGVFRALAADRHLGWSADRVAALVARKAVQLEQLESDGALLFPGAEAAVREAAAALPIAVASGALTAEILRVLDRFQLTRLFTAIVAAEDTPSSKPAPDPYRLAVQRLSNARGRLIPAPDCVAIEDSRWGLESARSAGLKTVGVTTSYREEELRECADLVIPGMHAFTVKDLRALY